MPRCFTALLAVLFTPILAYGQAGIPDPSFGDGPLGPSPVWFTPPTEFIRTHSITTDGEGRILVAFSPTASGGSMPYLRVPAYIARLLDSGQLDSSFGTGGYVRVENVSTPESTVSHAHMLSSMAFLPDGDLFAVGGVTALGTSFTQYGLAARIAPDGTVRADTRAVVDVGPSAIFSGVVVDGAALLLSVTKGGCGVVRLTPEARLDTAYGDAGWARVPFEGSCGARGLVRMPDGGVILAATALATGRDDRDVLLARFDARGKLDRSFGTDGLVVRDFDRLNDEANTISLRADGGVLVGGTSDKAGQYGTLSLAYTASGEPIRTFSDDGLVWTTMPSQNGFLGRVIADGKGGAYGLAVSSGAFTFHLLPNGEIDSSWGSGEDGFSPVASGSRPPTVGLHIDARGRVLVGGGGQYQREGAWVARVLTSAQPVAAEATPPSEITLRTNPNPTSGAARVRLTLPASGDATLRIVDALGREVQRLHSGPLASGEHTFNVLGDLSPGVYAAVLSARGEQTTRRFTVVR